MSIGKSIGGIFVSIGGDTSQLRKEVRAAQRLIRTAFGRDALQISERALQSFKYIAAGIGAVSVASVKMAGDLEQSTIAFETFLGSAEAAKKMLGDIQTFAAKTPFQFDDIEKSARMLLAFNTQADDVIPTLRNLGNIASATNQPMADLALIYGKVQVQNRLFMKDINQLSRRGIPIISALAESFGVTEDKVRGLVESGQANFGHLQKAINSLTSEGGRFFGLIEKQSKSFNGLVSTFKDNIIENMRTIGTSIITNLNLKAALASAIVDLQSFKSRFQSLGLKQALLGAFSAEVVAAITAVAGAFTTILIPALGTVALKYATILTSTGKLIAIGVLIGGITGYVSKANQEFLQNIKNIKEMNQQFYKMGENGSTAAAKVKLAMAEARKSSLGNLNEISKKIQEWRKILNKQDASFDENDPFKVRNRHGILKQIAELSQQKRAIEENNAEIQKYKTLINEYGNQTVINARKAKHSLIESGKAVFSLMYGGGTKAGEEKNTPGAGSGKADSKRQQLIEAAKQFHQTLRSEWIGTTKSEKEQLDLWLDQQINALESSKEHNSQYSQDLLKLNEVYQAKLSEIKDQEIKKSFEVQDRKNEEIAAQRAALQDWIEEQKTLSAQEAEIWKLQREANLQGYFEYFDQQKQQTKAHFQGVQEYIQTHMNLTAEAVRDRLSYMAEAYQTVYSGLSSALTDIFTGARSAGEAIRDLGKQLITMVVKWMVQRKLAQVLSSSMEKASTAGSIATAAAVGAAWAPAAAMVSAATMGANIGPAMAGLTGLRALSQVLSIPMLAKGGVVSKPTLAMIGEAGPEAVVPLSRMNKVGGSGNIQINVNNNSGVPMNAKANKRFDGTRTVIDLWIEGVNRNVSGVQDMIGGR